MYVELYQSRNTTIEKPIFEGMTEAEAINFARNYSTTATFPKSRLVFDNEEWVTFEKGAVTEWTEGAPKQLIPA